MTTTGEALEQRTSPVPARPSAGFWLRRVAPFGGYLLVQLFIVAGLTTPPFPDSATYTTLSFTGSAPQLPTVPLLYQLFPNDGSRLFGQALLAAVCWWYLAGTVAGLLADRRVRIAARLVILALGAVGPIASWNTTILSESTAISLTAALIAAWLAFATRPTWWRAGVGIAVSVAWELCRQSQVVLGFLLAAVALGAVVGRRRSAMKLAIALALVAVSAYAVAIVGRSHYVSNGNVADIIEDRILPNPGYTAWFIDAGMPYSPAVAATVNGTFGDALQAIPADEAWLTAHGTSTYLRFLLEHPLFTLYDPLPYFSGELASLHYPAPTAYPGTEPNPTPSLLSPTADYGRYRQVIPSEIANLLFEQGQIGDVLFLAGAVGILYVLARRRLGPDRRLVVPGLFLLSVIPQGYFTWLAGGVGELDRLSIIVAVTARIALWTVAALCADRLLTARPSTAR